MINALVADAGPQRGEDADRWWGVEVVQIVRADRRLAQQSLLDPRSIYAGSSVVRAEDARLVAALVSERVLRRVKVAVAKQRNEFCCYERAILDIRRLRWYNQGSAPRPNCCPRKMLL